jgi:hypothetical protein
MFNEFGLNLQALCCWIGLLDCNPVWWIDNLVFPFQTNPKICIFFMKKLTFHDTSFLNQSQANQINILKPLFDKNILDY